MTPADRPIEAMMISTAPRPFMPSPMTNPSREVRAVGIANTQVPMIFPRNATATNTSRSRRFWEKTSSDRSKPTVTKKIGAKTPIERSYVTL